MAASSSPPTPRSSVERIARGDRAAMARQRLVDHGDLVRQRRALTPVPGPAQSAPLPPNSAGAQRRRGGGVGDAHLAEAQHVDAGLGRHHAVGHGVGACAPRSSPAPAVKSSVGCVEVELVDAQIGVDGAGELVDRGAAVR